MKLSKWERGTVGAAALFLAFTAGWFLRGGVPAEPLRVETERRLEVTVTALPAPTPTPELGPVNINTADEAALKTLPGIGDKRAADIVADRAANGPFRFPEDLTRVNGIGEETLAGLLDYITTEDGPAPAPENGTETGEEDP